MNVKLIELRDRGTFIPMLALKPTRGTEQERYLIARAGYGPGSYVLFGRLDGGPLNYDAFKWGDGSRTYHEAHLWLQDHWDEIESGDVVDVEYILGETPCPKLSESESF